MATTDSHRCVSEFFWPRFGASSGGRRQAAEKLDVLIMLLSQPSSAERTFQDVWLAGAFKLCPTPSAEQIEAIATRLGLTHLFVESWFRARNALATISHAKADELSVDRPVEPKAVQLEAVQQKGLFVGGDERAMH